MIECEDDGIEGNVSKPTINGTREWNDEVVGNMYPRERWSTYEKHFWMSSQGSTHRHRRDMFDEWDENDEGWQRNARVGTSQSEYLSCAEANASVGVGRTVA